MPVTATYAACLTPPGIGAIATLALRGPRAWEVVRNLFRPLSARQPLPAEPEHGRFWLGRLGTELTDQVVLAVKRHPGEPGGPWVELHCHGGREVVRLLLETLAAQGVTLCDWQELERRTADDPLQAQAAITLAEARTTRTAAILLDQHQGALGRALAAVRAALDRRDSGEAERLLAELMRWSGLGRHLTVPWRVVVAGAPNVGKSSLVNALAGFQRSVVTPLPGTTRDVVTTLVALDGWPVELADTAGLRTEAEALEEQGIRQAREAASSADLCLWVLEATTAPLLPPPAAAVGLVVNKIDLAPAWDLSLAPEAVRVSAHTGAGLPELCQAIARWLVPEAPPLGTAVPFTPDLCDRIEEVARRVAAGQDEEAGRVLAEVCG